MKISNQNFLQISKILIGLYETGTPCNVTLYFQDNEFNRIGRGIHIDHDRLPLHILLGRRNYVLKIRVNGHNYFMESRNPLRDPSISFLYRTMTDTLSKMKETFINKDRKQKLDDILDDTKPITLE